MPAQHQSSRLRQLGRWVVIVLVVLGLLILGVIVLAPRDSPGDNVVLGWLGSRLGMESEKEAREPASELAGSAPLSDPRETLNELIGQFEDAAAKITEIEAALEGDSLSEEAKTQSLASLAEVKSSMQEARNGIAAIQASNYGALGGRNQGEVPSGILDRRYISALIGLNILGIIGWILFLLTRRKARSLSKSDTSIGQLNQRVGVLVTIAEDALTRRQELSSSISPSVIEELRAEIRILKGNITRLNGRIEGIAGQMEGAISKNPEGMAPELHPPTRTEGIPDFESGLGPLSGGGRFSGPVRGIKSQIPPSAKDMEFKETHKLLVYKQTAGGKKFKVFQDSRSQKVMVVPWVERAFHADELAWLHGVFDVQWDGEGDVNLLSEPSLEAIPEGYRVRSRGQLKVG